MQEYLVAIHDAEYSSTEIHRIMASSLDSALYGAVYDHLEEEVKCDRLDQKNMTELLDSIVHEGLDETLSIIEDWSLYASLPELL